MSLRLLLTLCVLLGGCATGRTETPPICDGRERRPANPYGSILVPSPSATPSAPPVEPVEGEPSAGGCA
ncbi:hypothetical protein RSD66_12580 [Brevundimonas sp. S1H14]|jgi:hypothetical protein|uniref:hypothetical protein n=1 Tax=Brevundimonas TaxID=41275 RepID=UPI00035C6FAB|nr:hypothetical protein [Brevundimonas diminuta]